MTRAILLEYGVKCNAQIDAEKTQVNNLVRILSSDTQVRGKEITSETEMKTMALGVESLDEVLK